MNNQSTEQLLYAAIRSAGEAQSEDNYISQVQAALVNSPSLINAAEQETGNTPLHIAAWHNLPGITGLLLRQNADPNQTNRERATPFDYLIASQSYHIEKTLSELLSHGTRIWPPTGKINPIDLAIYTRPPYVTEPIVSLLINHGVLMTLFAAVKLSRPDDVDTTLMRGLPNKDDWPSPRDILDAALSAAIHDVENGHAREVLRRLLEAGMDPNDRTPTSGRNYLHEACASGAPVEVISTLAPHIHNINETTTDGETALDLCAEYPHTSPNVIRRLAKYGALRNKISQ